MKDALIQEFSRLAASPERDLASPALVIARLECPLLDPAPYLAQLDAMGAAARERLLASGCLQDARKSESAVDVLNAYLFEEEGFTGNRDRYEDPSNSFLNEVLDRRTGIPITLALVYMEVARRAGIHVEGINFPGHFLMRYPPHRNEGSTTTDLILDPFHRGARLTEHDCRRLFERHVGESAPFDNELLAPATKPQMLTRILLNLKRIYVRLHSFPQARSVTELLLAVDPPALTELRDRGLLAYHMNDFSAALRDLQQYLHFTSGAAVDEESRSDHEQLWEHVKTLRRRVASLN
ncbi:MAG: transglutaminase-like domain-containing protein [Vicinamibacterales bacterium]|nr:transglutaminase-like domain-containing protein [Vicinamibacterales bacterium]